MVETRQYGFLTEGNGDDDNLHTAGGVDLQWLPLSGATNTLLHFGGGDPPYVAPIADLADQNATKKPADTRSILFEVIQHDFQTHLAMMAPPDVDARLNGLRVGPVVILKTKDHLRVRDARDLYVSVLHKPAPGPAEAAEVGCECLICRTPITANQTIFRCTNCSAAMHAGAPERNAHDRLECAVAASDCPRCRLPLVREERFEYVPDI